MDEPVPALADRATACAERLLAADSVLLASHNDADGLTSGAIASAALARAGIAHEVVFEKQLDEDAVAAIADTDHETVLFTDFGSGQLDVIAEYERAGAFTPVIADHHQPADAETTYHLNPLLVGIDGAAELSGAGATYVLARALADSATDGATDADGSPEDGAGNVDGGPDDDPRDVDATSVPGDKDAIAGDHLDALDDGTNRDLAALAVVGAVGDMQASGGELHGANAAIVEEGIDAGVLETGTDLALYGKQTRPLPKLLEYSSDVHVPGISNDRSGALRFLDDLDVDLKRDGEWRRWIDLDDGERQIVASALVRRAVSSGVPADEIDGLVGTTYTLVREDPGTELRDASEFSTLLNATARYERADVGLAVCLGDRSDAYDRARSLLATHRRNLSAGVEWVRDHGVEREEHLQWFHAGDEIKETIVGIVAGMAVGVEGVDRNRPIVAFARDEAGDLKVSARATPSLVRRGVDLSVVMSTAAAAVDGEGGGHDIAAGATIPEGTERSFVEAADDLLGDQLG